MPRGAPTFIGETPNPVKQRDSELASWYIRTPQNLSKPVGTNPQGKFELSPDQPSGSGRLQPYAWLVGIGQYLPGADSITQKTDTSSQNIDVNCFTLCSCVPHVAMRSRSRGKQRLKPKSSRVTLLFRVGAVLRCFHRVSVATSPRSHPGVAAPGCFCVRRPGDRGSWGPPNGGGRGHNSGHSESARAPCSPLRLGDWENRGRGPCVHQKSAFSSANTLKLLGFAFFGGASLSVINRQGRTRTDTLRAHYRAH